MDFDLPLIWAGVIGVAVAMYVILDGFDLGIGILFPFTKKDSERDQMVHSIAPFWDGNETWLVLGGGGLFVAFPRAYAIIMSAFYMPVIVMLLALVFRGVAFEFRNATEASRPYWNAAFAAGSTLAGFCSGRHPRRPDPGHPRRERRLCRRRLRLGDAVRARLRPRRRLRLCAARRDLAGDEDRRARSPTRARGHAKLLLLGVLAFMAVVSLWTPLAFERIAERWFSQPNIFYLWPVPALTALVAFVGWRSLEKGRDILPFLSTIALFLLGYLGLVISVFPYLVPPSLTIWETAAAAASQVFMLIGTVVLLPIILGYVVFVYWLFRGKVREGESYHH